jgi:hypothetical protein
MNEGGPLLVALALQAEESLLAGLQSSFVRLPRLLDFRQLLDSRLPLAGFELLLAGELLFVHDPHRR